MGSASLFVKAAFFLAFLHMKSRNCLDRRVGIALEFTVMLLEIVPQILLEERSSYDDDQVPGGCALS